jgi:hypothetical protein
MNFFRFTYISNQLIKFSLYKHALVSQMMEPAPLHLKNFNNINLFINHVHIWYLL